ncbi:hypothetical protein C0J52_17759 [Blattella germanica]|nr:hypothetical protein C0J52_17759 [Blattella germanica]PSN33055.1 hypothetical protein C0J52_17759 [Blattella germanica]
MPLQIPGIPKFRNFLCCSLKSAALTFGWLSLVSCLLNIILLIAFIVYVQKNTSHEDDVMNAYRDFLQAVPEVKNATIICLTLFCLLITFLTVMLVHGMHNEAPSHMVGFLLTSLFFLTLITFSMFVSTLYLMNFSFLYGLYSFAGDLFYGTIALYIWATLYNYYRELEDKRNGNTHYENLHDEHKLCFSEA